MVNKREEIVQLDGGRTHIFITILILRPHCQYCVISLSFSRKPIPSVCEPESIPSLPQEATFRSSTPKPICLPLQSSFVHSLCLDQGIRPESRVAIQSGAPKTEDITSTTRIMWIMGLVLCTRHGHYTFQQCRNPQAMCLSVHLLTYWDTALPRSLSGRSWPMFTNRQPGCPTLPPPSPGNSTGGRLLPTTPEPTTPIEPDWWQSQPPSRPF